MRVKCPSCDHLVPVESLFCGQCGARIASAGAKPTAAEGVDPAPTMPAAAAPSPRDERREVVVLFADVSGFTAMAEGLDPEELHSIMNRCFAGLGEAITSEGGYIDKYIGDNVMALFGAPLAHEDDPSRACRAALAMQHFLHRFATEIRGELDVAIQMRIGIHQGIVLAGHVGSKGKMDYTVMGDAVNVAARLETAAPPGCILVSEAIRQRTQPDFKFGTGKRLKVKGKGEPILAYRLVEEQPRTDARQPRRTPLVGRERELAALLNRLDERCRAWIDVRGALGVGKTHLVEEAARRRPGQKFIRAAASAVSARQSFGLARRLVHEILLAGATGGGDRALDNLDSFARAMAARSDDLAPYVPALWYVAAPSRMAVLPSDPDPHAMRSAVERGISVLIEATAAGESRLVLFLDQYEHADEPSAALLESLASEADRCFAIIAAARTECSRPPVAPKEVITIGPLDDEAAAAMLDALTEGSPLDGRMRQAVLRRAGNVPLFIRTLAEGIRETGENIESLPSSLRSALVARLDRLPEAHRDLLSQCSAQGVEFDLDVAMHVRREAPWNGPEIGPLLADLEQREVIAATGAAQRPRRAFRVPLFRDACYQMLLMRDRRLLHRRIAESLVELSGSWEQAAPDLLAFHFEQAECWLEAGRAHGTAADRAASLYLNDEAIVGYEKALEMFQHEPALSPSLAARVHAGATEVLLRIGRYDEASRHATAMSALAGTPDERTESQRLLAAILERTGRTDQAEALLRRSIEGEGGRASGKALGPTWFDLAHLLHRSGKLEEAMSALAHCRALAGEDQRVILLRADLLEGSIEHIRGRLDEAERLYRSGVERARSLGALAQEARASNNLGNTARDKGDYAQAALHYHHALELWKRIGDSECAAGVSNNLGNLAMSRGEFPTARKHYAQSLDAAVRIGNVHAIAIAHANLGMLALETRDAQAAVRASRASLDALGSAQNEVLRALVLVVLGDGLRLCGDLDEAQRTFGDVLSRYANQPLAVATAHRGLGRIAAARRRDAEARSAFERAIAGFAGLKRSQEEQRTRLDFAELLAKSGDLAAAREQAGQALAALRAMDAQHDAARAQSLVDAFNA